MGIFGKLLGRKPAPEKGAGRQGGQKGKSEFRAVEIVTKNGCCGAASELHGQRFLSNDVPLLPLKDCTAANCECSYRLLDDRRADTRRASDLAFDMASQLHQGDQRSAKEPGRRSDD